MECSIHNCFNRADGFSGIILYALPQDLEKREQWIEAAGCGVGEPVKNSVVCSVHFDNASFLLGSRPPTLSDAAVPTVTKARKVYSQIKSVKPRKKFQLKQKNNKLNKQILRKTSFGMLCMLLREQRLKNIIEREKKISRSRLTEIRRLRAENSKLSAQLSALSGVIRAVAWREAMKVTTNADDAGLEDETDKSSNFSASKKISMC